VGRGSVRLVESTIEGLSGYSPQRSRAFTAPFTPMNERIHNARSITHLTLPLATLKAIAHAHGATLNDVALCILDAGLNRYLRSVDRVPEHPLVGLVPVSLRESGACEATTMVASIWPTLGPVTAPIEQRLATIVASVRTEKEKLRGLGKDAAYSFTVMAFAMSETLAIAQPEDLGLRPANVLISNVRGPAETLYLNGAELEALFPVSTLIVGIGLNVTLLSYAGKVIFGFTANGSALPEVESLARYTRQAFAELENAQARPGIGARRGPARRRKRPGPVGKGQRKPTANDAPDRYLRKRSVPLPVASRQPSTRSPPV
jgi:WS/DGAT/MGAT family acyltransferase